MAYIRPTLSSAALAPGATAVADVDVRGFSQLFVISQLAPSTGGASASGDISAFNNIYLTDGSQLSGPSIPVTRSTTVLQGSTAISLQQIDLYGVEKVRFFIKNNHATSILQPILDIALTRPGV